ncbi:MAG: D-alanyl-D-alanine carboxypeptidase [Clostridia bacterium]|nr:D-alanyl-D-alanine carboxypeptidase [Clostridia bacterium]
MKKIIISICCILLCIVPSIFCGNSLGFVYADGEPEIEIDAKSAFLMDFYSGDVLFEKNSDEKVQVASIVKLMTILLTLESIESGDLTLEEKLTTSEEASGMGGSQVFIDPYTDYTIEEMLKSVIVSSANDASVALAEKIAGTEQTFVKKMNERAKQLEMNDTLYANSNGLPEPEQYSTARDSAKLLKEVIKHKDYFKYSTIWMDTLTHPSGRETELTNTNKLIRYFKGCDSGKTGSTDEAGYCLSASAERGNMRLIGVVLGSKGSTERFNATSKLLNYGFSNFENKQIVSTDQPITNLKVLKSKIKECPIYASENFYGVTKKGDVTEYSVSVESLDKIKAPMKKDNKIGTIKVSRNGVVIKEIDLIVSQDIDSLKYIEGLKEIISNW